VEPQYAGRILRRAAVIALLAPAAAAAYGPPERIGTITSTALPEVSGLVASRAHPGGFWAVNDSGNTPDVLAIDAQGRLVASVRVRGAVNRDWEDIGAGPGPGGRRALFVADIGDNGRVRDDLVVYRVPEPGRRATVTARAQALPFRYPDGRHDAEAIAVDPSNGRIYVLTKGLQTRIYAFPLPQRPGRRLTLTRQTGRAAAFLATVPAVTGAAVSPDGTRLAVRTYLGAYELRRRPGSSFESTLAARPEPVLLAPERQGESIAYSADGRALVTSSEQLPAPVWRVAATGS
jgi:hypothetical protein